MKYYKKADLQVNLEYQSIYDLIYKNNTNNRKDIALVYYGNKISYGKLLDEIEEK